jgi:hypothetical protein
LNFINKIPKIIAIIANSASVGRGSTIAVTVDSFEKNKEMTSLKLIKMQNKNTMTARINMYICFLFISCPWHPSRFERARLFAANHGLLWDHERAGCAVFHHAVVQGAIV